MNNYSMTGYEMLYTEIISFFEKMILEFSLAEHFGTEKGTQQNLHKILEQDLSFTGKDDIIVQKCWNLLVPVLFGAVMPEK